MDLRFTEEQQLLADSAAKFFEDAYDLPRRRERVASEHGYSEELWSSMAELGWLALRLPEKFGGFGMGAVESALIMEGLDRKTFASRFHDQRAFYRAHAEATKLLWQAQSKPTQLRHAGP